VLDMIRLKEANTKKRAEYRPSEDVPFASPLSERAPLFGPGTSDLVEMEKRLQVAKANGDDSTSYVRVDDQNKNKMYTSSIHEISASADDVLTLMRGRWDKWWDAMPISDVGQYVDTKGQVGQQFTATPNGVRIPIIGVDVGLVHFHVNVDAFRRSYDDKGRAVFTAMAKAVSGDLAGPLYWQIVETSPYSCRVLAVWEGIEWKDSGSFKSDFLANTHVLTESGKIPFIPAGSFASMQKKVRAGQFNDLFAKNHPPGYFGPQ